MKQKIEDYKDYHQYDDIINLAHPVSTNHAHMPLLDRAAQFSPFAALTGYDSAIKETARQTVPRRELDEDERIILNEKLKMIQTQLKRQQKIEIVYFRSDEYKAGGSYLKVKGVIKKLDEFERVIIMQDDMRISMEDIIDIYAI